PRPVRPRAPAVRHSLRPARLVVKESGLALPLPDAAQALVGRADPVSNFYPDIDLSPYGALQAGVGRRHVRIQLQGAEIFVEDLDSTNGTFLNGQRLLPHTPCPLKHGDEMRLGAMALVVQLEG
ncbi:MAG: FHA domain-containing protein, partial [Chloroflexaceae bacterium]|nr:FHA domain-containing protein [Chloroflexaceae bacterium]